MQENKMIYKLVTGNCQHVCIDNNKIVRVEVPLSFTPDECSCVQDLTCCTTVEDFTQEILKRAENFNGNVRRAIEKLEANWKEYCYQHKAGYNYQEDVLNDYAILAEMQEWSYNPKEIARIAQKHWNKHGRAPTANYPILSHQCIRF